MTIIVKYVIKIPPSLCLAKSHTGQGLIMTKKSIQAKLQIFCSGVNFQTILLYFAISPINHRRPTKNTRGPLQYDKLALLTITSQACLFVAVSVPYVVFKPLPGENNHRCFGQMYCAVNHMRGLCNVGQIAGWEEMNLNNNPIFI